MQEGHPRQHSSSGPACATGHPKEEKGWRKGAREKEKRKEEKKKETEIARNRDRRVAVKGWGGVRQFNGYIVLFLQTQKILEARNTTM